MIPYMVRKLAPNSSLLTRGLVKSVSGRGYFRAVPSQNGDKYVTYSPSPIVELVASTRMILVHVQKMYNIFRGVPDYSSSRFLLNEEEAIPPPPDKQNTPGILYRNTNTTGKKLK